MKLGKMIERNVGESLSMAGVEVVKDLKMDFHQKVDYAVESIDGMELPEGIALQISLRNDPFKVKIAKLLALTKYKYLVYVHVSRPRRFRKPSIILGEQLKEAIKTVLPMLKDHPALLIELEPGRVARI